ASNAALHDRMRRTEILGQIDDLERDRSTSSAKLTDDAKKQTEELQKQRAVLEDTIRLSEHLAISKRFDDIAHHMAEAGRLAGQALGVQEFEANRLPFEARAQGIINNIAERIMGGHEELPRLLSL